MTGTAALGAILKFERTTLTNETRASDVAEMTREEIDAKIQASEARNDTKFAKIDGKLDLLIAKIDANETTLGSVKNNIWAATGVLLAGIALAIALSTWTFSAGSQLRDMVQKEVKDQLPK